jgi:hypothetical protein
MSNLFLDTETKLQFEKVAMPVRLSESPEAWQRDIAGEIYKQLPFLGDYAVNVIIDRVDAQRGYGFGSAYVTNKTDAPMPNQTELPSVRIPIIIRDYVMSSLDIFMDSSGVYPLTESRVREKLFRTDTFELSTRKPSDKGLVDQLYPPFRTNYGMGSVGSDTMGIGKFAADAEAARKAYILRMHADAAANPAIAGKYAARSLLDEVLPTITEKEASAFVDQILNDEALRVAASTNETFASLAEKIANAGKSIEKRASAIVDGIRPTVVQFEKLAGSQFKVKWANVGAFMPQEGATTPEGANAMTGMDLSQMQPGNTLTLGTEKAQKSSLLEQNWIQVEQAGGYIVQDMESNQQLSGVIMPVIDFEMQPLELWVFASEGAYAVQDQIAGVASDEAQSPAPVPLQNAQGDGVLVWSNNGKLNCLLPMTIHNAGPGMIQGENVFGEPVNLQVAPGIQAIELMGEGTYGIPDFFQWMPLQNPLFLAKEPLDVENVGEAQNPNSVQVGSTGPGEFSMDGAPLAKVADEQKKFIKKADAEFLLVAMGVDPFEAKDALKRAEEGHNVKVAGIPIVPLAVLHRQMAKQASDDLANFPFQWRMNLIKEAAAIDDADTADKILSMNFLNPENIGTFAGYLPDLDAASCKLAEMLVATRLGMGTVDEGAIERSMKALEVVIDGLKLLQQKSAM